MSVSPTRRAVVVSGASTGIGRATALRLARAGHRVFAGVRKQADAEALLGEGIAGLTPLLFDVTDGAAVAAAAKSVSEELGEAGLQGVVANAGIGVTGALEFIELDEVRRQLEVNVIGVLAVVQAFLPLVRKGRGRVVITGSIGGRNALPFLGAYSASKFALEAVADALRRELRPSGIEVSLLEPGAIATPMLVEKGPSQGRAHLEQLTGERQRLYEGMGRAMLETTDKFIGSALPPDRAARAIEHALTAPRPRTRYLIGRDARLIALAVRLLPDRVCDAIFERIIGIRR